MALPDPCLTVSSHSQAPAFVPLPGSCLHSRPYSCPLPGPCSSQAIIPSQTLVSSSVPSQAHTLSHVYFPSQAPTPLHALAPSLPGSCSYQTPVELSTHTPWLLPPRLMHTQIMWKIGYDKKKVSEKNLVKMGWISRVMNKLGSIRDRMSATAACN